MKQGKLACLSPLVGKTVEEALAWLSENEVVVTVRRVLEVRDVGVPHTTDNRSSRVNVRLDEHGRIRKVEGVG